MLEERTVRRPPDGEGEDSPPGLQCFGERGGRGRLTR